MNPIKPKSATWPEIAPVRRALVSVFDKTGIVDFAAALQKHGASLLSTGGTARTLADAGLRVEEVSDVTGFPEIMDGRVKTLHPVIHGGLLAVRGDAEHEAAMAANNIDAIDLVAINLYPFEEVAAGSDDPATIIENIDIGGPAMLRAAAKNAAHVTVVVDPADYRLIADALAEHGGVPADLRRRFAAKAFARTAGYDAAVARWHAAELGDTFPERLAVAGRRVAVLRYGENPHQKAALYASDHSVGVASSEQVQGKALSYNNINDADAALGLVADFGPDARPTVAIIKHANPCGVAMAPDLSTAHALALRCDPVSAFGGIVAVNRRIDQKAAEAISDVFTEVVIAPDASPEARTVFSAKPNLRLLLTGPKRHTAGSEYQLRTIAGGFLAQNVDGGAITPADVEIVTKRAPTEQELRDLVFAFCVAKHVKSNAIVYARDGATVGIGAGQMSRVDSARIAAIKAGEASEANNLPEPLTLGSVVASDAFFPFADGLLAAVRAGATAVIQPGGSVRDEEVIAAADDAGIAMVFTGIRHFRH